MLPWWPHYFVIWSSCILVTSQVNEQGGRDLLVSHLKAWMLLGQNASILYNLANEILLNSFYCFARITWRLSLGHLHLTQEQMSQAIIACVQLDGIFWSILHICFEHFHWDCPQCQVGCLQRAHSLWRKEDDLVLPIWCIIWPRDGQNASSTPAL